MLFNSIDFAIFLSIVFILYWFVAHKSVKLQNVLIVIASYVFYGWWDWRFLTLILFSSLIDYVIGLQLFKQDNPHKRKILLWTSLGINLGLLGFFKYFNFFIANFIAAFSLFGVSLEASTLRIILPVGISFYTFQTMSYSIDVYRGKLKPTSDLIAFLAFVSFFPQLVAGPIERATHLLSQFYEKRTFDYFKAADGMRQILWGLFKKVVIADNCAMHANLIFNHSDGFSGSTLALGALFFTFQIYGDFSGYSDIAIGISRLFGFDLMRNFAFPYFSRDIAEFWRRWHISLSTWFRDYVYIPMGGSRGGTWMKVRNIFVLFILSGFWHGANWTFIAWGALNAVYFLPLILTNNHRSHLDTAASGRLLPAPKEFLQIIGTFILIVGSWIFFRAENIGHATSYIAEILSPSLFEFPKFPKIREAFIQLAFISIFVLVEWNGRTGAYAIQHLGATWKRPWRLAVYYLILLSIFWFAGKEQEFIYFQF